MTVVQTTLINRHCKTQATLKPIQLTQSINKPLNYTTKKPKTQLNITTPNSTTTHMFQPVSRTLSIKQPPTKPQTHKPHHPPITKKITLKKVNNSNNLNTYQTSTTKRPKWPRPTGPGQKTHLVIPPKYMVTNKNTQKIIHNKTPKHKINWTIATQQHTNGTHTHSNIPTNYPHPIGTTIMNLTGPRPTGPGQKKHKITPLPTKKQRCILYINRQKTSKNINIKNKNKNDTPEKHPQIQQYQDIRNPIPHK